jgi:hypothetical protein
MWIQISFIHRNSQVIHHSIGIESRPVTLESPLSRFKNPNIAWFQCNDELRTNFSERSPLKQFMWGINVRLLCGGTCLALTIETICSRTFFSIPIPFQPDSLPRRVTGFLDSLLNSSGFGHQCNCVDLRNDRKKISMHWPDPGNIRRDLRSSRNSSCLFIW